MGLVSFRKNLFFLALLGTLFFSHSRLRHHYTLPFPHFNSLNSGDQALQDAATICFGFRLLAADVAWVQLLQYVGGYSQDEGHEKFLRLKDETLRVTRIDPYFYNAYLFGASMLAWMKIIDRPEEAMEVLQEGIIANPQYWAFRVYAAGIGYKKTNQMDKMIRMLEEAYSDPACPTIIKSVLANSYKAQKRYGEALSIWEAVQNSPKDQEYHHRARIEIPILKEILQSSR